MDEWGWAGWSAGKVEDGFNCPLASMWITYTHLQLKGKLWEKGERPIQSTVLIHICSKSPKLSQILACLSTELRDSWLLGRHPPLEPPALLFLFCFWVRVSVTLPRMALSLPSFCLYLLSSWDYRCTLIGLAGSHVFIYHPLNFIYLFSVLGILGKLGKLFTFELYPQTPQLKFDVCILLTKCI
jgi:hypothetical protein